MILDAYLKLSAAQAVTASAASTSYIDTLAAGNAIENLQALLKVDTSADSSGSAATLTVAIQTDDNTSFTSPTTIASTGAIAEATLITGFTTAMKLPSLGMERYIRGYYTAGTENLTAGNFTLALVTDVDTINGNG